MTHHSLMVLSRAEKQIIRHYFGLFISKRLGFTYLTVTRQWYRALFILIYIIKTNVVFLKTLSPFHFLLPFAIMASNPLWWVVRSITHRSHHLSWEWHHLWLFYCLMRIILLIRSWTQCLKGCRWPVNVLLYFLWI